MRHRRSGRACAGSSIPIVLVAMRDTLEHRGPDDAGSWLSADGRVGLGHRRLSIVDLTSAAHQPMPSEDERLWLTLNGEIYNHRELRGQLEARGHRFRSACDAEVVLHGYEEWGIDVLERLYGNVRLRTLGRAGAGALSRPRPLRHQAALLLRARRPAALRLRGQRPCWRTGKCRAKWTGRRSATYLVYRYVPSPKCIWKGLAKLPPASWLRLGRDGAVTCPRVLDAAPGRPAAAVRRRRRRRRRPARERRPPAPGERRHPRFVPLRRL